MIGWAAATSAVSWESFTLFVIIFLWTPPHFWALALYRSDDYRRAGVPMLPVVAGPRATKKQMLAYTLALVPVALRQKPSASAAEGALPAKAGWGVLIGFLIVMAAVVAYFMLREQ